MNKKFFQENVLSAYFWARRYKINTINQLEFQKDYIKNCLDLSDEIMNVKYKTWKSICFVNYKPVIREIFAWNFRDRVVHHLIFNYINDFFEDYFIYDSYSCRTWKWTIFWVNRMRKFVRMCSKNYTEKCRVLQLDISWYFMNLNKKILFDNLKIFLKNDF